MNLPNESFFGWTEYAIFNPKKSKNLKFLYLQKYSLSHLMPFLLPSPTRIHVTKLFTSRRGNC